MRILITGGTGSLGRALIKRFLALGHAVCAYARCEVKRAQLLADFPDVHAFLGDVRDRERLDEAMHGVDVVVAAAALKRVDGGYQHTMESIKTNVLGIHNTITAALLAGVKKVVVVSSDKAVHAENSYGSTKHLAEFLAISANEISAPQGTVVSAVRYGNVLASRGSVAQLWQAQVARGERLRMTDPDMTRFWLRLADAVGVIEHCLARMRGGEIFVPKLPAMRVRDLARAIGGDDYPIEITGLRNGGEKRHEQLVSDGEVERTLNSNGFLVIPPQDHSWTADEWEGDRVPSDFRYTSDVAPFGWLSTERMRAWLSELS